MGTDFGKFLISKSVLRDGRTGFDQAARVGWTWAIQSFRSTQIEPFVLENRFSAARRVMQVTQTYGMTGFEDTTIEGFDPGSE